MKLWKFSYVEKVGVYNKLEFNDKFALFKPYRIRKSNYCYRCGTKIMKHMIMYHPMHGYPGANLKICTSCMHDLEYQGYIRDMKELEKFNQGEF